MPSSFRVTRREDITRFLESHAFGLLVSSGEQGLSFSHIPFLFDPDRGEMGTLFGHLSRANPHLSELATARETVAVFEGPHGYVSPRWYADLGVPTWNYAIVHAHGSIELIGDDELEELVSRLAARHERSAEEPWRFSATPDEFRARELKGIAGFALVVTRFEAKFKLSQNRDAADRARVIAGLRAAGNQVLADLMAEREASSD